MKQVLKTRAVDALAPVIMVQGTSSSVGKSLLVTGLCRALTRHGLRVAPFKAQNMALNSHVTRSGGEIGTAQAIQAEACRVEATVDMNPILLKPEAERRSQVVVLGKVMAPMSAMDYHKVKPQLRETIMESLNRLRRDHDVVVIEGAGSPAEVNLKENDLVNMFVARSAQAPVLLVGDIDRGGVFAAFVGTIALLTEEEQALVRGFIVNKFRGDIELLKPGLTFLEERTGIPVTGVLPFLPRLRIGDEDSIALDDKPTRLTSAEDKCNVAILRYPRISNYDEFNALEHESSLHVAYVQNASDIIDADVVILPGSKSVMSDLNWLRLHQLDKALQRRAALGKPIVAICGGYQMLSHQIQDPFLSEADTPESAGLGLIPFKVVFQKEKTTCRVLADVLGFDCGERIPDVEGYEIHMGEVLPLSAYEHQSLASITQRGLESLAMSEGFCGGSVRGTLIHGLFQDDRYRQSFLKWIWARKRPDGSIPEFSMPKDDPFERLADSLEAHLDFDQIYDLLNGQIRTAES